MFARVLIAGSALLAFTACCTHRSAGPTNVTGGPVQVTQQVFRDKAGNTVTLRLDDSKEAREQPLIVKDSAGNVLKLHEYPLSDVALCLLPPTASTASTTDAAKHAKCERASSASSGMWIKFGEASCTCKTVFEKLKCWGDTCP